MFGLSTMTTSSLVHELLTVSAEHAGESPAITSGGTTHSYSTLAASVLRFAAGLRALDLSRGQRVGIYLDKRVETVVSYFGTSAAGGVFVPVNPVLKNEQVAHIFSDCDVSVLVTSAERWEALAPSTDARSALRHVVLVGDAQAATARPGISLHRWDDVLAAAPRTGHRVIDADVAAIFYTSGSTGRPKGVVLSHRNIVTGGKSVAQYLGNHSNDVLLAALPLSFDAGFSQLTTGFHAGARVVLINYLMPRDVVNALHSQRVTGLTAVPPLWIQLAALEWPASIGEHLRYIANTGGRMPLETLQKLRAKVPATKPYLMYGLTEAFRATYLPPEEVARRPDSIGKSIPNSEVMVLREDGSPCAPNEPGELVQRGALVSLGYWNNPEATAERFKALPKGVGSVSSVLPEIAVFSGDTVRMDEEGFLYFIGRRDEMIKTSGYRVSPMEVEEIIYSMGLVAECVAFGVAHDTLGQVIHVVAATSPGRTVETTDLLAECRKRMPAYMVPAQIELQQAPLPRNPNGKLDRKQLASRR
jgi:acyl-CoA ligase (AMP-forming) (exosortase A-associated)